MKLRSTLGLVLTLFATSALGAELGVVGQRPIHQPAATESQQDINYYNVSPEALEEYRQWKFGMLVSWSPSVLGGGEVGWSSTARHWGAEFSSLKGFVPEEEYNNFYKQFKTEKFNAKEIFDVFKDAGIQYAALSVKGPDGFCMWDTKLSDYKSTSPECPADRDFFKEWADASRATGLKNGIYFSQTDWYHPDYMRDEKSHKRYIETMHGWIRELFTDYGKVDYIFFDGLGGTARNWDSENLFAMMRQLQPDAVVNMRCGAYDVKDWPVHRWLKPSEDITGQLPMTRGYPGDFDTPEQGINRMQTDRPWETCMPLQHVQWQYSPNVAMKSPQEVIGLLLQVVGRDGSLLVSAGIMPDGRLDPRAAQLLKACGKWMKQYGKTIYDTRGGPYYPTPYSVATYRDNTIFVHIVGQLSGPLTFPPIQKKLISSSVMTGGEAEVSQDANGAISISLPKDHQYELDNIIVLKLDGPAKDAKPGMRALGSVATGKKVTVSNVYSGLACFAGDNAVDDDIYTRWATDFATKLATLEVDLGQEQTFDGVYIKEDFDLVRKFEVQYKRDGQWVSVVTGERIGANYRKYFEPVTARHVRLSILDAISYPQFPYHPVQNGGYSHTIAFPGPTIWEFQVTDTAKPIPGSNIAFFGTTTMEPGAAWGHIPQHVIDGNYGSYSQSATPAWDLKVDLHKDYPIDTIKIQPNSDAWANEYTIKVSTDNEHWTTVHTATNVTNQLRTIEFDTIDARYVWMDVTGVGHPGAYGHGIYEFEIFMAKNE